MTGPDPRTVTRSKTMQVTPAGPGQFRFSARLTDSAEGGDFSGETATIHDFALDGEVEGPDLTLVSLQVRAYSHPYAECPFVIPATRALLGKSLMTAWRRSVLDELGGSRGCTHVTTMLLGLGELATMVFFLRINEQVPYTPAARDRRPLDPRGADRGSEPGRGRLLRPAPGRRGHVRPATRRTRRTRRSRTLGDSTLLLTLA